MNDNVPKEYKNQVSECQDALIDCIQNLLSKNMQHSAVFDALFIIITSSYAEAVINGLMKLNDVSEMLEYWKSGVIKNIEKAIKQTELIDK